MEAQEIKNVSSKTDKINGSVEARLPSEPTTPCRTCSIEGFFSPEGFWNDGNINRSSYPANKDSVTQATIVKTCVCGHVEADHDRRWDVESVLFSDYYPCKSCECNSFTIDQATRRKISILANEQWQRFLDQNRDCLRKEVIV